MLDTNRLIQDTDKIKSLLRYTLSCNFIVHPSHSGWDLPLLPEQPELLGRLRPSEILLHVDRILTTHIPPDFDLLHLCQASSHSGNN